MGYVSAMMTLQSDWNTELSREEEYTLQTLSRPDEFESWTSRKVDMRVTRAIPGGFGTVYCVSLPLRLMLTLAV